MANRQRIQTYAPSLVPRRAGERVKTDRRDAKKLARLLRSGELEPVWVPGEAHEALRDLVRAREDAQRDVIRKRHQISKFLLRLGLLPPQGVNAWTTRYRKWLEGLRFKYVAQYIVLREYLHALDEAEAMVERLEAEIAELAQTVPGAGYSCFAGAAGRRIGDGSHCCCGSRGPHQVHLTQAADVLWR